MIRRYGMVENGTDLEISRLCKMKTRGKPGLKDRDSHIGFADSGQTTCSGKREGFD